MRAWECVCVRVFDFVWNRCLCKFRARVCVCVCVCVCVRARAIMCGVIRCVMEGKVADYAMMSVCACAMRGRYGDEAGGDGRARGGGLPAA
jgi:hypothetical protein